MAQPSKNYRQKIIISGKKSSNQKPNRGRTPPPPPSVKRTARRDEGLLDKRLASSNADAQSDYEYRKAIADRQRAYVNWLNNIRKQYPESDYDLVLAGKGGWDSYVKPKDKPESYPEDVYSGYGYGGGGEEVVPPEITWSQTYSVENAPDWWKGMTPSEWNADTEFASIVNSLIPFLTPEDQRQMGTYLSRLFPKGFDAYNPEKVSYPPPAPNLDASKQDVYLSAERAQKALSTLDKLKEVSGKSEDELGEGYKYMRQIVKAMQDFGGTPEGRQTRRQVRDLYSTLDPLLSEAKNEKLGAYGEIARAFTQPFFSSGRLLNVQKDQQGNWVFGKANKKWF